MSRSSRWSVLLALLLAATASGCAKPQAAAVEPAPPPALTAPVPPPRIILPPQPDPPAPIEAEVIEAPARPQPMRPTPRSPEPKPEVNPVEQLAEAPPRESGAATPPLELKQRGGPDPQSIRQQLDQAADDLENVDYARLSRDLQAQYETAKRFIVLGGQALKEQNVLFAATLADKARAIARLLLQR